MKKFIYVSLFTLLGFLVSFLVKAAIEIPVIHYLLKDFETFGLGLSWREWEMVHDIGTAALLGFGSLIGFLEGRRWWRIMYINRPLGIKY